MAEPAPVKSREHRQYRSKAEAWLFDACMAIIPRLPRFLLVGFARFSSWAGWYMARRDRRIALANLKLAFGDTLTDRQRAWIVRRSFQCFAQTVLDYMWFSRDTQRRLARYVTFDESVAKWVRRGGPFVAVTAHFGNWELLGKYTAMQGVTLATVVKPVRNVAIDQRVNAFRATLGQVVVPRQGALRTLMRVLKEKGVVALLLDQDTRPEEGGVFVPFFGVPAPVSNAAALLALRFGVPLVPAFSRAEPGGRYRCYACEALMPEQFAEGGQEALTVRITAAIEAEIRAAPEQWLWTYKRWKRRQPGVDPSLYPFYADC